MPRRVTLYGRDGCHLCDRARLDLLRLAPLLGFEVEVVDIESDPDLERRYLFEIPVVAVDGAVVAQAPIDERALREALEGALGR